MTVDDVLLEVPDIPETATLLEVIRHLNARHKAHAQPSRPMNWNIGGVDGNGKWHFWDELPEDQWPSEHRAEIIAARDSWKAIRQAHEVRESRIRG